MAVVTIAHQLGSRGREIGQAVAQQLGMDYVDRQIVAEVARQLDISEQTASAMDEKASGVALRLITLFNVGGPYIIPPSPDAPALPVGEHEYFETTRQVIEAAARSNRAVIAGHGANFALAAKHGVLHVYVYAPKDQRIATLIERDKITPAEAAQRVQQSDRARDRYIKTFYNANWQDPLHYHLMINTGVVPCQLAVGMITEALHGGSIWRSGNLACPKQMLAGKHT